MNQEQTNGLQMTTFVFNDEEITTKLVYGILSQALSALLGRVIVKPHPYIKQAVVAECAPHYKNVVQSYLDKIIRDYALTVAAVTFDYIADNDLVPKERSVTIEKPRLRLLKLKKSYYRKLAV